MQKNVDISLTDLPRRLKSLREERHLTKTDLAEKSELSYRTIHDLEEGRKTRVQSKTLMLLTKALGISYDDLFADPTGESGGISVTGSGGEARPWWRQPALLWSAAVILVFAAGIWFIEYRAPVDLEWSEDGGNLVARDRVLGTKRWEKSFGSRIRVCETSPWSKEIILVGLSGETVAGGRLLALDLENGRRIWELEPDREALARAFGTDVVYTGNYHCHQIVKLDLDGDGARELIVHFGHSKWYPNVFCFVDREGRLESQYANYGSIYDLLPLDLDADGKEELVVAGTNNAKAYQGGTVFILDDVHRSGAALDVNAHPESTEPDSALVRVVFPQFPSPYMQQMRDQRLAAREIRSFVTRDGDIELSVDVGVYPDYDLVIRLDHELHPLSSSVSDVFVSTMESTWPESLLTVPGPADEAWREKWLATHLRFEAGHWPPPLPTPP